MYIETRLIRMLEIYVLTQVDFNKLKCCYPKNIIIYLSTFIIQYSRVSISVSGDIAICTNMARAQAVWRQSNLASSSINFCWSKISCRNLYIAIHDYFNIIGIQLEIMLCVIKKSDAPNQSRCPTRIFWFWKKYFFCPKIL